MTLLRLYLAIDSFGHGSISFNQMTAGIESREIVLPEVDELPWCCREMLPEAESMERASEVA